jgi:hypothetical protein
MEQSPPRETNSRSTRVEAGSNTSTVILRVARGDEMGLKKAAPQLKRLVAGFPRCGPGFETGAVM